MKNDFSNKKQWQSVSQDLKKLIHFVFAMYFQNQLNIDLENEFAIKNEILSYLDMITTKEILSEEQIEQFFRTINLLIEDGIVNEIETIEQVANVMIYIWLVKNTKAKILTCPTDVLYCILEAMTEQNQPFALLKPHLDVFFNEEVFLELSEQLKKDNSNIIHELSNLYEESFQGYNKEKNKAIFLKKLKNLAIKSPKMTDTNKSQLTTISDVYNALQILSEEVGNIFGLEMQFVLCPEHQLKQLHKFCYLPLARQQQFLKEINTINCCSDFSLLNRISLMMNLINYFAKEIDIYITVVTPEFGRKRGKK